MRIRNWSLAMIVILASTFPASGEVLSKYRGTLTPIIDQQTQSRLADWLAYYKDLHTHPELSLNERESARKMAGRLRAAGYDVTTGVGGHGVVGTLHNGDGPTVLIRGDMDALPITEETGLPYASKVKVTREDGQMVGAMHACGHDIHQTCLVGTAELLAHLRDRWSGTVLIVAQPAEEIGTGALAMLQDGFFDRFGRPDYLLALHVSASHPAGTLAYTSGWALANVDSVDITIFGRGGHGSRPNEAVDPVVAAAQVVVSLQTIVSRRVDPKEPAVITVGSIHAGSKHNIISNEAKLQITVRSYTDETRRILLDGIRDVTRHTTRAMGCETDPIVSIREKEFTPATYNDPALAAAAAKVFERVVGKDNTVYREAVMGGEDFGRFPKQANAPGFIFWLGAVKYDLYEASQEPNGPPLPSLHSSKFAPDPKPTITTGVRGMTSLALSLLKTK